MNDNEPPLYMDDPPEWVSDIIDKHDLWLRADCPRAAVTVLLADAADLLKEASSDRFRRPSRYP